MTSPSFSESCSYSVRSARVGGDGFFDVAEDVLIRVQVRLLFQEADGEAFGELGLAVEVLIDAGHDPQQRALAGAIAAENADLRAG